MNQILQNLKNEAITMSRILNNSEAVSAKDKMSAVIIAHRYMEAGIQGMVNFVQAMTPDNQDISITAEELATVIALVETSAVCSSQYRIENQPLPFDFEVITAYLNSQDTPRIIKEFCTSYAAAATELVIFCVGFGMSIALGNILTDNDILTALAGAETEDPDRTD